jgi:hypothetical protein
MTFFIISNTYLEAIKLHLLRKKILALEMLLCPLLIGIIVV